MLKLQCYDGTDSLDTFLRKFQSMARYLQWSEEDAMYIFADAWKELPVRSCGTSARAQRR